MDVKRITPVPVVQPTRKVERDADRNGTKRPPPDLRRRDDDDETDDGTKRIDTYA